MSWPMVALGDVVKVNPRLPKDTDESQLVTFLKMASVSEQGELLEQESRVLADTKKGFTYFERNDVLLAKITPCFENGKAALVSGLNTKIGFGSTEFHVIRPMEGKIDKEYLFYLVWNEQFRFLGEHAMKGAAGQQRISADFLKGLKIPLPPLETQKQIAAVLEKADQLRKDCQQMEQELKSLAQSVFIDMFGDPVTNPKGWELCSFEDLTTLVTYGLTVRPRYHEEGVPLISARELRSGVLNFSDSPKISPEDFSNLSDKGCPKKEDILFSKTGSIGHCAIVETDMDFAVTQNAARIVVNKEKCHPEFLLAFLRTDYFYNLANRSAKGNAVKDLQLGIMKKFPMYIPPVEQQLRFLEIRTLIYGNAEDAKKQKIQLEDNFNSLMQRAFKGELSLKPSKTKAA